jgi:hypothetical protein
MSIFEQLDIIYQCCEKEDPFMYSDHTPQNTIKKLWKELLDLQDEIGRNRA